MSKHNHFLSVKGREDNKRRAAELKPKAYIYARVSTDKQANEGTSIDTQIQSCKRWLNENPFWQHEAIFADEGVSGTKLKRPEMNKMRKIVKPGDIVVVHSLSRLFRELMYLKDFLDEMKKKDVKVHSLSESIDMDTAEGVLTTHLHGAIAEFQAAQLRARLREKYKQNKLEGRTCNGKAPYGHNKIMTPVGSYIYPCLKEQQVITTIIDHRDAGKTWNEIIRFLFDRKKPPRNGTVWADSSLRKIYEREKNARKENPLLEDEDVISRYETFKAPIVIPYDQVVKFVDKNTRLFDHAKYNRENGLGLYNYAGHKGGGVYLPTLDDIKYDVESGVLQLKEKDLKSLEKGQIIEDVEDPIITKIMESNMKGIFLSLTEGKSEEEKISIACKLLNA